MAHVSLRLLKQPGAYFDSFESSEPSWYLAYAGFYMMTFVESVGNLAFSDAPPTTASILGRSLVGALGAAVFNAVTFGILWLWVGSKIVRGTTSLVTTTKACGYAFLFPSALGLLTVPSMLWVSAVQGGTNWIVMIGTVALQLVAGLWALGTAFVAVRRLNGFGWGKTLVVASWFPGLIILVIMGVLAVW